LYNKLLWPNREEKLEASGFSRGEDITLDRILSKSPKSSFLIEINNTIII
jgi:hypothetical protein